MSGFLSDRSREVFSGTSQSQEFSAGWRLGPGGAYSAVCYIIIISGSACSTGGVHSQAWSTSGIGLLISIVIPARCRASGILRHFKTFFGQSRILNCSAWGRSIWGVSCLGRVHSSGAGR
jgi:hypothetical protein